VETRERNEIDSQLTKIRVELTREAETAGHTGHGGRDEVVEITIGRSSELEGSEADIIQSLVINHHHLISILYQ
jgi:hypothetical protein